VDGPATEKAGWGNLVCTMVAAMAVHRSWLLLGVGGENELQVVSSG